MKKSILKEDLDLETVSFEGQTLEDLYETMGDDLFDEANIPGLKAAGLIDENGWPVEHYTTWQGEDATRAMSMYDLCAMSQNFIKSPFIRDLAFTDLYDVAKRLNKVNDLDEIKYDFTSRDLPSSREISDNFLEACFADDGSLWDYFYNDAGYSFSDCSYAEDDIPEEVLDTLESYGFPRDIYSQLFKGTEDEDHPLADYYEDLKMALVTAYQAAYESGAVNACQTDFDRAFEEAIPEGVTFDKEHWTEDKRPLLISESFIEKHLEDIWGYLDSYSESMYDCLNEYLVNSIKEAFDFNEPYTGWWEFDEEAFGDRLLDEIMELDIKVPDAIDVDLSPEEKDLLKFDGETGEYHEAMSSKDIRNAIRKMAEEDVEAGVPLSMEDWVDFKDECEQRGIKADPTLMDVYQDAILALAYGREVKYESLEQADEDLDIETVEIEKPKKLFYKYKEYNPEISSKAYRLNYPMLMELMDFLHKHKGYVDDWDLKDLEAYIETPDDAQYIILSKIKPSYETTYGGHGYTIWIDNGDYDLYYIGWVPKDVGDDILKHGLKEDLDIDIVAVPEDIDELNLSPDIEEFIIAHINDNHWCVRYLSYGTGEENIEIKDASFEDALKKFLSYKKEGFIGLDELCELCYIDGEEYAEYDVYSVDCFDVDDIPERNPMDEQVIKEERVEPNYTYYECYMERASETSWKGEDHIDEWEPSSDNQSCIIKVSDDIPTPTAQEVEVFLESQNLLPEGYTVLYLGEGVENDWIEECDYIPEYVPADIELSDIQL